MELGQSSFLVLWRSAHPAWLSSRADLSLFSSFMSYSPRRSRAARLQAHRPKAITERGLSMHVCWFRAQMVMRRLRQQPRLLAILYVSSCMPCQCMMNGNRRPLPIPVLLPQAAGWAPDASTMSEADKMISDALSQLDVLQLSAEARERVRQLQVRHLFCRLLNPTLTRFSCKSHHSLFPLSFTTPRQAGIDVVSTRNNALQAQNRELEEELLAIQAGYLVWSGSRPRPTALFAFCHVVNFFLGLPTFSGGPALP